MANLAFEFLVLTAARWSEVRWAEWEKIDQEAGVWTVPAKRMKANRKHRVRPNLGDSRSGTDLRPGSRSSGVHPWTRKAAQ
ncbi:MAG: tyrosine-type recombinase/integrase [Acidobacteria bacterium]|nr:tyrosine-type recombinase/integrase [Acidobacteriota bacterium]